MRTTGGFDGESGAGSVDLRLVLCVHKVDVVSICDLESDICD